MAHEEHARLTANVRGRVQGVGFRYYTQTKARLHGLTGWVRNEHDDTVSLEAEGPREKLEHLLRDIQFGPPTARVDHVDARWSPATGEFATFSVRH